MTQFSLPPFLLSALQLAAFPMSKEKLLAYAADFGASQSLLQQFKMIPLNTFVSFEDIVHNHGAMRDFRDAENALGSIRVESAVANSDLSRFVRSAG